MKKIGIMSMQRIVNYGSFLQAFGLKMLLEELGYSVQFVDYNFGSVISKPEKKRLLKKIISNLNIISFINKKMITKNFRKKYMNEFLPLLGVKEYNYNPKIDALVIGSDEVFNCLQDYPVGFSKELFGKNYENIDVISYAASFGHTSLEGLKEHNLDKEIKTMLNRFKSISVRDKNSYEIIKNLLNHKPYIHLDPALIYNYDKHITNNVRMINYIIVYAYTGRMTRQEEKYVKSFAKKRNKKIISLGSYQKIADYNIVVSPFEMLEYIKKADYVITDTFHGTIFSVINHTKFCTIIRNTNNNKLSFLLEKLGLDDRKVCKLSDIDKLYIEEIDFSETEKIIEKEKNKTKEYLKQNLK